MTPVPLHLPLRPSEATELANLIFDHAERKPLTEELRNRLASRAGALQLQTVTPYFGSLERDPVHPSAYYLAVDGSAVDRSVVDRSVVDRSDRSDRSNDIRSSPQLLYLALATAPTSSIYHKPLLIGRMRRPNGPEMVINAIPFGPSDRANVETFAARINNAFYSQPQGARATITVEENPPAAFSVFRTIRKRTGQNVAALSGDCHAAMWAAIRAGWRAGYTAAMNLGCDPAGEFPDAAYSRYSIPVPLTEAGLNAAEEAHERIRRSRAALKIARAFDFEVIFDSANSPDALRTALERLREGAHAPQLIGGAAWVNLDAGDLGAVAALARQFQMTLTFPYRGEPAEAVQAVARATAGRVNYSVRTPADAEFVAEQLL